MHDIYENPLISRYASREMAQIFSDDHKFRTWRRLWVALAEAEHDLGLEISQEQIDELKAHCDDINYDVAQAREKEVRHDVMSHVYAYGVQCPKAKGIIHLGATSCYVGDNADIIIMRDALELIRRRLLNTMDLLAKFALDHANMPTLGFTHYQPAQLTTVGKRACLWLQDLWLDYQQLEDLLANMPLRGVKGTTGTQASFMTLFDGDSQKVRQLEKLVVEKLGYAKVYPVTGQTYPRKLDYHVLSVLSGIAQSAYKFANDIRLLQNLKEIEEPFESKQIGSSAMAYKRNPMRSERLCSLARFVITLPENAAITASTQWFERTLDDSANKRLSVPQAFLATDSVLKLYMNIADGLVLYPKTIERHMNEELPFMATETILMEAVKRGGDRQELHEKIRELSMQAAARVKMEGLNNNLIDLMAQDAAFRMSREEMDALMAPINFVGRALQQVKEFLEECIVPILNENAALLGEKGEISI
ncbi:MAG: adenylosuccinate lyase [Eubacteriales bacterium]|nr:adenylosuccinate lyase [Eubacteriales bacterium]